MENFGNVYWSAQLDTAKINQQLKDLEAKIKKINLHGITPIVDDRQLTQLNRHLDLKLQHYKQVQNYFNANPLTIKIQLDRTELDAVKREVDAFKRQARSATGGSRNVTQTIDVQAQVVEDKNSRSNKELAGIRTDLSNIVRPLESIKQKIDNIQKRESGYFRLGGNVTTSLTSATQSSNQSITIQDDPNSQGNKYLNNIGRNVTNLFNPISMSQKSLANIERNSKPAKLSDNIFKGLYFNIGSNMGQYLKENLLTGLDPEGQLSKLAGQRTKVLGQSIRRGAGVVFEGVTGEELEPFIKDLIEFQDKVKNMKTLDQAQVKQLDLNVDKQLAKVIQSFLSINQTWEDTGKELIRASETIDERLEVTRNLLRTTRQRNIKRTVQEVVGKAKSGNVAGDFGALAGKENIVVVVGGFAGKQGQSSYMVRDKLSGQFGKNTGFLTTENIATDLPFSAASNPIGWITSAGKRLADMNVGRGYTQDAVEMAAQVLKAREVNPKAPIDLVGYSAGGYVVDQTLAILKELGITDVKGTALATPINAGIALSPDNPNFQTFMSRQDPIGAASALLGGVGLRDRKISPTYIDNLTPGHGLSAYLDNPLVQERLRNRVGRTGQQPILDPNIEADIEALDQVIEDNTDAVIELDEQLVNIVDVLEDIRQLLQSTKSGNTGNAVQQTVASLTSPNSGGAEQLRKDISTIANLVNNPPNDNLANQIREILNTELNAEGIRKLARYLDIITKETTGKMKTKGQLIEEIASSSNVGKIVDAFDQIGDKGRKAGYKRGATKEGIPSQYFQQELLPSIKSRVESVITLNKQIKGAQDLVVQYQRIKEIMLWLQTHNKKLNITGDQNVEIQGQVSKLRMALEELRQISQSKAFDVDFEALDSLSLAATEFEGSAEEFVRLVDKMGLKLSREMKESLSKTLSLKQSEEFMQGFYQGFKKEQAKLKAEAVKIGQIIDQGVADELEIRSPSKKAYQRAVQYIQGFIIGAGSKAQELQAVLEQIFDDATNNNNANNIQTINQATEQLKSIFSDVTAELVRQIPVLGRAKGLLMSFVSVAGQGVFLNALIGGLRALTNQSFEAALHLENLERNLSLATGKEGIKIIQRIREETDRLGTSFLAAADGYAQFTASTIGTSLNENAIELLEKYQQAFAVAGLTTDAQQGALLALSQIASKSVVSMEELRQQLAERLPGALNSAAKALGVTVPELNRMVESGTVLAEDLLPALANQLEIESAVGLAKSVNSTQAELNRLENNIYSIRATLGETALFATKMVLPIVNKILPLIEKSITEIVIVMTTLAGLIGASLINSLMGINAQLAITTKLLPLIVKAVNFMLPILKTLAVVTAIITTVSLTVKQLNSYFNAGSKDIKNYAAQIKGLQRQMESMRSPSGLAQERLGRKDRDFSTILIPSILAAENPLLELVDTFWDMFTLRSTIAAKKFLDDFQRATQANIAALDIYMNAKTRSENVDIGGGMSVANDYGRATVTNVQKRLEVLRGQQQNIALQIAFASSRNDNQELDALVKQKAEVEKEIAQVMSAPFGDIAVIQKALATQEALLKTLQNEKAQLQAERGAYSPENYNARLNTMNAQMDETRRNLERLKGLEDARNEAIKETNNLYAQQIQPLRLLQRELANSQFFNQGIATNQNISNVLARARGDISTFAFEQQGRAIREESSRMQLGTSMGAFRKFEQQLNQQLGTMDSGVLSTLAQGLGVDDLGVVLRDKTISPQAINALLNSDNQAVRDAIDQNQDIKALLESAEQYLTVWGEIREQQLSHANLVKEEADANRQRARGLRDFAHQLQDLDLSIKNYFRQRARQVEDFEKQYDDIRINTQRQNRGLVEQYEQLGKTLDKEIRAATQSIAKTRNEIEGLEIANAARGELQFGGQGLFSGLIDFFANVDAELDTFGEQRLSAEEQRLAAEEQTLAYSRQIRDLSEQASDLERDRYYQLRQLARQQEDFVLSQEQSWRQITRQIEQMELQANEMGLDFLDIGNNINRISELFKEVMLNVQSMAQTAPSSSGGDVRVLSPLTSLISGGITDDALTKFLGKELSQMTLEGILDVLKTQEKAIYDFITKGTNPREAAQALARRFGSIGLTYPEGGKAPGQSLHGEVVTVTPKQVMEALTRTRESFVDMEQMASLNVDASAKATAGLDRFTGIANQCANAVKAFYDSLGVNTDVMNATANSAKKMGTVMTDFSQIRKGDIIGWDKTTRHGDEHVGVYMGGHKVLHQSRSRGLKVGSYNDFDYFKRQQGAYFVRLDPSRAPTNAGISSSSAITTSFVRSNNVIPKLTQKQKDEITKASVGVLVDQILQGGYDFLKNDQQLAELLNIKQLKDVDRLKIFMKEKNITRDILNDQAVQLELERIRQREKEAAFRTEQSIANEIEKIQDTIKGVKDTYKGISEEIDSMALNAKGYLTYEEERQVKLNELTKDYENKQKALEELTKEINKLFDLRDDQESLNNIEKYIDGMIKRIEDKKGELSDEAITKLYEMVEQVKEGVLEFSEIEAQIQGDTEQLEQAYWDAKSRIEEDSIQAQISAAGSFFGSLSEKQREQNPFAGNEFGYLAGLAEIELEYIELGKQLDQLAESQSELFSPEKVAAYREELNSLKENEVAELGTEFSTIGQAISEPIGSFFSGLTDQIRKGQLDLQSLFAGFLDMVSKFLADLVAQYLQSQVLRWIGGMFGGGGGFGGSFGFGGGSSALLGGGSFGPFASGGLGALAFKNGGMVPYFAGGGFLDALGKAMMMEGSGAVPVVAHVGQQMLSAKTGDAQFFRRLERSGIWTAMKQNWSTNGALPYFEYGGSVGMNRSTSRPSSKGYGKNGGYAPTFNIYTDAETFKRSRSQIAQEEKLRETRSRRFS